MEALFRSLRINSAVSFRLRTIENGLAEQIKQYNLKGSEKQEQE